MPRRKYAGWRVAAAILAQDHPGEWLPYKDIAQKVTDSGLSGLGERDGETPHETLGRQMREHPAVFESNSEGKYLIRRAQALADADISAALSEYLAQKKIVDVEEQDLTDDEIDQLFRSNRLRLGIVATGDQLVIARRRRGQDRLHELTLEYYKGSCAVCDVTDHRLLVASHIVGWAEAPEHRGNLRNVICLCRMHDALFEKGYWSLRDDFTLLKRSGGSKTVSGLLDSMTPFQRPGDFAPSSQFLAAHRQKASFSI